MQCCAVSLNPMCPLEAFLSLCCFRQGVSTSLLSLIPEMLLQYFLLPWFTLLILLNYQFLLVVSVSGLFLSVSLSQ